jgi:L-asparagine transporter-like permease
MVSYLIDIVTGFYNFVILVAIFSAITAIISPIITNIYFDLISNNERVTKEHTRVYAIKILKFSIIVFLISVSIATIIPSKRTLFIYAGENYSEQIIKNNPILQKTYKLIIKKIDKEIGETK